MILMMMMIMIMMIPLRFLFVACCLLLTHFKEDFSSFFSPYSHTKTDRRLHTQDRREES